jgi:hypothetical protein
VVAVLPQASVAVNVLICVRLHPVEVTGPSAVVIVGVLQLSVAEADPSAAFMSDAAGLQPNDVAVPLAVITGFTLSNTV